ncbi:MAG: tRNA uridine(34) 5-carboxymethylaminomethyl modification radical SAM/GNAT enzyme Elp3 [Candidatus Micrarchaeia archaeon]
MKQASPTPQTKQAQCAASECAQILINAQAKGKLPTRNALERVKALACKKCGAVKVLRNSDILEALIAKKAKVGKGLALLLKTKEVRSLSGISAVAIMAKPAPCPGACIYCPQGANAPKSYTGFEPATRRAIQNDYDPYKMVSARLEQFKAVGHDPQKCELIIMGGTFNAQPEEYQREFVKRAFDAFNGKASRSLEAAQKLNEKAKHRVIGLTFETRPDYASKEQLLQLLEFGGTRIELGVQSIRPGIYEKVNRRHTLPDVVDATRNCKDLFLKVGYHMMPGLFATPAEDVAMFKKIFSDEKFKPDMLKIYPCLVMPNTKLYDMWKKGEFEPYDEETAVKTLSQIKRALPKWVRVMRIERDIPSDQIAAGIKLTNIRQMVHKYMKNKGWKCNCIRCREAGLKEKGGANVDFENAKLNRIDYSASGGKEIFLSFDDEKTDSLLGFLRLRQPSQSALRAPVAGIGEGVMGVRELHVYGEQVPIGGRKGGAVQHKGFGAQLLAEAEKIAKEEFDSKKLFVISGVGAREYYKKQGYKLEGAYMAKKL